MEQIDSSPALPHTNPRKRPAPEEESPIKKPLNLTGTQFMMPTPPDTDQSSNASPTHNNNVNARQGSPAPSSSALSSVEVLSTNGAEQPSSAVAAASGTSANQSSEQPPKKKRKLTPDEKIQQQREKEAKAAEKAVKDAEKAAEKAKKDEEKAELKAHRDDEKRVKDEEKRKKAEEREAKKREKELEEERKQQAKAKKERSQMRLGVFFQAPATPIPADRSGSVGNSASARRRSISLEPFDAVADQIRRSVSPSKKTTPSRPESKAATPAKQVVSDYNKYFLPFELRPGCSMPPLAVVDDPEAAQDAFDYCVNDASIREKYDLGLADSYASLEQQFSRERQATRGRQMPRMRQLVDQIQGTLHQPIDLTSEEAPQNPMDTLQSVSRRYLEFHEDVRPAYYGTYTKIRSPRATCRLRRNPFSRTRTDTDYDYDSEAEWDEPEEGEEILDEEDDEAESVGDAHEMDEFLDDEDDAMKSKRKMVTTDLLPTSTGLCWEDERGKILPSIEGGSPTQVMRGMRIGVLLQNFSGCTIDPFSTTYWDVEPAPVPSTASTTHATTQALIPGDELMPPPTRVPLQPRPNNNSTLDHMLVGAAEGMKGPINSATAAQSSKPGRKSAPKSLSKEDLDEFKEAVVGSQLGKAELLKGLKARFPKMTNDTIKSTLGDKFAHVGASKADKKWVYVGEA